MRNVRISTLNFLFLVFLLPWSTYSFTCTSPYIETYSERGILCYWVLGDSETAANADTNCQSLGGYLAEIPDSTAYVELISSLRSNYPWLTGSNGLHLGYILKSSNKTEARRPPNGEPAFTSWASDEPSYNSTFDKCVAMDMFGTWYSVLCSDLLFPLCFNNTASQCTFNRTDLALLHMSVETDVVDFGSNATVTCDEGHALFVNHTSQEAVTNMICQCVFDKQVNISHCQPYGNAYNNRCDLVTCPELPMVKDSYNDLVVDRNYTYGETVTFNCTAGYILPIMVQNWPPQLTTNCTEIGQWSVTPPANCKKSRMYIGCYAPGALDVVTSIALTGQLYCTNNCKDLDFRFAASANGSCFCGNYLNPTASTVDDMHCNMTCPLITAETHFAYCGGESGQESIYQTLSSYCYKEFNMTGIATFMVTGNDVLTCQQRCLAENVFYSILWDNECACTNSSSIQGTPITPNCDDTIAYNGTRYTLEAMFGLDPDYESCEKLYEAGVKDNGYYNLKRVGKTYCNFKDGTVCPAGWIGYKNECYLFQKGNFTFENAVKYCQQLNATVASLLNSVQNGFAASTIAGFQEFQGSTTISKKWFIGLFDPDSITAYSWTDGNLLTEQQFAASEPMDENLNCVVLFEDDGLWYSHSCSEATNVICKQSGENMLCMHEGTGLDDVIWNATLKDMTLTMCIQACLARNTSYSLARNETCFCVEDIPATFLTSFSNCDSGCPANSQQMCGGTEPGYYTVTNLMNATVAKTCEDLQSQGLTGDKYKLSGSDNATVCENTGCPYSWIKGNSSCYKLMLGKKRFFDSILYCANYSSHLLVMETEEEESFINEVIGNLTFYSSASAWSFGLQMTGYYTNRYYWSNGKRSYPLIRNITDTEILRRGFFKSATGEWRLGGSTNERSYICEQSDVYSGCYLRPNTSVTLIVNDKDMSVQQCVESCRGMGYDYALLKTTDCLCDEMLPIEKFDTGCWELCGKIQPCGPVSNDAVSVFKTWLYPSHDTCMSLYDQGIVRSGLYLIDGVNTTCNFYDNTSCPTNEWIGHRKKCYMFIEDKLSQDDLYTRCASLGSHILTVTDVSEHNFLRMVLKGNSKYAYTEIRIGLVDQFGLGINTWATGALPSYFPRPSMSPKFTAVMMQLNSTNDYGFVMTETSTTMHSFCELQTQHKGCFSVPESMNATISNYNNMELTQCKQICMGSTSLQGFALIHRSSCYCNETLLGLTPNSGASCNDTCPGNSLQVCGGSDVVNAYELDHRDMVSSCSSLYKSGVWIKGTYLIGNSTQECGTNLFDTTSCPESWYGKDGTCYKFASLETMAYTTAESTCFQNGGYLFYPRTQESRLLFVELLPYIYQGVDGFWTSVKDELYNSHMRAGDGWVIPNGTVVDENIYIIFNLTTGSFNKHSTGTFGVICEKSSGYVGCTNTDTKTTPIAPPFTRSDMSATLCIQYCMGETSSVYSILQSNECSCYNDTAVFEMSENACEGCPDYSAQPCGSSSSLSVYKLSHYASNLASSCAQLFDFGIRLDSIFVIQPKENDPVRMHCFLEAYSIIWVGESSITASSYKPPHVPSLSSLLAQITYDTAWIPAESGDPDPWLKIEMPDDYLVTGMITFGRPDPSNEQWSETFEVKYKSTVDSSWHSIGSLPGNTDRTSQLITMFPRPFVSRRVRIYPGGTNIALRVALLGTLMVSVDYSSTFIGCFPVFNTTSSTYVQHHASVASDGDCRVACGNTTAFYSYDAMTFRCSCHAKLDGKLDPTLCSESFAADVHRLYELECREPSVVNGSTNMTTFAHVPNVFTVSSQVQYTCGTGYEFYLDNTTTRTITCGGDYLWHGVQGDYCRIISCPDFTFANGTVSTLNNTYNTEVVFTCDKGFNMLSGSTQEMLICQANKTWNSTIPVCHEIDCGTPPTVPNTVLTGDVTTYGVNVTYTCINGMRFAAYTYSITSQCGLDGEWDLSTVECTAYMCLDPPTTQGATFDRINTTIATYTCYGHHYFPDGSSVKNITCNDSFVWEEIPKCTINESLVTQKGASILFIDLKRRQTSSSQVKQTWSDSNIDCGDQCLRNSRCVAFNYKTGQTDANCILFSQMAPGDNFVAAVDWSYFEVYDVKYLP